MDPSLYWWAKETYRRTPVVVKMENPNNWSMVELESPSEEDFMYATGAVPKGGRNRNAKQLTWVLLLKAHKAAGCLTSITAAFFSLAAIVRRRIADGTTDSTDTSVAENPAVMSRFLTYIKVFLCLSLILLRFKISAYFKGWHFGAADLQLQNLYTLINPSIVRGVFDSLYSRWVLIRVEYLAPLLQFLINICIILFLIQSMDRLICVWVVSGSNLRISNQPPNKNLSIWSLMMGVAISPWSWFRYQCSMKKRFISNLLLPCVIWTGRKGE